MLVVDPVSLYKDKEWRRIPAVDAQSWINAGWSLTEVVEQNTENPEENSSSSNQPTLVEDNAETINLQHEPSDKKVEQPNTELTPTETKVEPTKRKSSN
jgi:hypothetical protein